jgi:serine/threonine protein kinase
MLTLDPAKRISARECVNHPWIQSLKQQPALIQTSSLALALGNLRKFHASKKLAQLACLYITTQVIDNLTQIPQTSSYN